MCVLLVEMTSALDTSVVAPVSPSERPGLVSAVELVSEALDDLNPGVREGASPLGIHVVVKRSGVDGEMLASPEEEEVVICGDVALAISRSAGMEEPVGSIMVTDVSEEDEACCDSVLTSDEVRTCPGALVRCGERPDSASGIVLKTSVISIRPEVTVRGEGVLLSVIVEETDDQGFMAEREKEAKCEVASPTEVVLALDTFSGPVLRRLVLSEL